MQKRSQRKQKIIEKFLDRINNREDESQKTSPEEVSEVSPANQLDENHIEAFQKIEEEKILEKIKCFYRLEQRSKEDYDKIEVQLEKYVDLDFVSSPKNEIGEKLMRNGNFILFLIDLTLERTDKQFMQFSLFNYYEKYVEVEAEEFMKKMEEIFTEDNILTKKQEEFLIQFNKQYCINFSVLRQVSSQREDLSEQSGMNQLEICTMKQPITITPAIEGFKQEQSLLQLSEEESDIPYFNIHSQVPKKKEKNKNKSKNQSKNKSKNKNKKKSTNKNKSSEKMGPFLKQQEGDSRNQSRNKKSQPKKKKKLQFEEIHTRSKTKKIQEQKSPSNQCIVIDSD